MKILNGKQTRDGQPYGSILTCKMTYEIEFKERWGFRYITQAKNPRTGEMDEPIIGIFALFMVMTEKEGRVYARSFTARFYEDIKELIEFIGEHEIEFTKEQSEWLWGNVLSSLRMNLGFAKLKKGVNMPKFLEAVKFEEMAAKYKEGADFNDIKGVGFDVDYISSLKM